jgi:hypothetical protein
MKKLSVFLVESMRADDLYNGLLEAEAIAQILRLLRVEAVCRTVIDRNHLSKAIQEAMKIKSSVFHLSCHAGQDGFDLTAEENLSWTDLAKIAKNHLKKVMLCLSGCEAGNIATAEAFRKQGTPPPYIVGPETDVGYAQACVAWSVFYHYLAQNGVSKEHMQCALDRMNQAVNSKFLYRRWTGKKYLRYPPAGKSMKRDR